MKTTIISSAGLDPRREKGRLVIILPVWLWLIIVVIALIVAVVARAKKAVVDNPRSARAVAVGAAIPDSQLESRCRAAILNHELTAPGQTQFVALLQPLEFTGGGDRARTPISLGLTERTLGVSYKKGSVGNTGIILIDRLDIKTGFTGLAQGGFSYSMETAKVQRMTFRLQSQHDLDLLASWVQSGQRRVGDSAQ
jgi:hypothetical protein